MCHTKVWAVGGKDRVLVEVLRFLLRVRLKSLLQIPLPPPIQDRYPPPGPSSGTLFRDPPLDPCKEAQQQRKHREGGKILGEESRTWDRERAIEVKRRRMQRQAKLGKEPRLSPILVKHSTGQFLFDNSVNTVSALDLQ